MASLAEACADLRPLLPVAAELITEPDIQARHGRSEPASCPPWNAAAANAWLDIHAAVRDLERLMRYEVYGIERGRGGSTGNTYAALEAIQSFGDAVTAATSADAARILARLADAVLMLPAVDLEERPRKLPGVCPVCGPGMVWARVRRKMVACFWCGLRGVMREGTVSDGCIEWEDGAIT